MSTFLRLAGCFAVALGAAACRGKKAPPPTGPAPGGRQVSPAPLPAPGNSPSGGAAAGAPGDKLTFIRPGMPDPVRQTAARMDDHAAWAGQALADETARLTGLLAARQREWDMKVADIEANSAWSPAQKAARVRDIRLESPEPPGPTAEQQAEWDDLLKGWYKAVVAKDLPAARDAVERMREMTGRTPGMLAPFQRFLQTDVQPALEIWADRPEGAAQSASPPPPVREKSAADARLPLPKPTIPRPTP